MTTASSDRARWHRVYDQVREMWKWELVEQNKTLATILDEDTLLYFWSLADGSASGVKESSYAAMRRVRKALREGTK